MADVPKVQFPSVRSPASRWPDRDPPRGVAYVTISKAIKLTGARRNTLKQHFRVLVERDTLKQHRGGRGVWYKLR
jgi:hypothetical protein